MKVGVYFVLYLAVVLEILIIIVDRDDAEADLRGKLDAIQIANSQLLTYLAKPPSLGIESEVVRCYVAADQATGMVTKKQGLALVLKVKGLDKRELLSDVEIQSVLFCRVRNSALPDSQIRTLLDQSPEHLEDISSKIKNEIAIETQNATRGKAPDTLSVNVPLTWSVKQTGLYKLEFYAKSNRIKFIPDTVMVPDTVQFGEYKMAFKQVQENTIFKTKNAIMLLDNALAPLYVAVIDSAQHGTPATQLMISTVDPPKQYAIGNEVVVPLSIEGAEPQQVVSITPNFGKIESSPDKSVWRWKAVLPPREDGEYDTTIVLAGQDSRGAGGKSISLPTRFTMKAVLPVLTEENGIPERVCQNEPFTVSVQARGLDKTNLYELRLYVDGVEDQTQHVTGKPRHTFSLPNNVGIGGQITVKGFYEHKECQYYDEGSKQLKPMACTWSVEVKRVNVTGLNRWPKRVGISGELKFSAYRACNLECAECKTPIEQPPQVRIIDASSGEDVTRDFLRTVEPSGTRNEYVIKFNLDATFVDPENGDRVRIEIRAAETVKTQEVTIRP